jgi:hypothetical protein
MKKIFVIVVFLISLVLVACGSDKSTTDESTPLSEPAYKTQVVALCKRAYTNFQELDGSSHAETDLVSVREYYNDKKDLFDIFVLDFDEVEPKQNQRKLKVEILETLEQRQKDFQIVVDELGSVKSEEELTPENFTNVTGFSAADFKAAKELEIEACIPTFIY